MARTTGRMENRLLRYAGTTGKASIGTKPLGRVLAACQLAALLLRGNGSPIGAGKVDALSNRERPCHALVSRWGYRRRVGSGRDEPMSLSRPGPFTTPLLGDQPECPVCTRLLRCPFGRIPLAPEDTSNRLHNAVAGAYAHSKAPGSAAYRPTSHQRRATTRGEPANAGRRSPQAGGKADNMTSATRTRQLMARLRGPRDLDGQPLKCGA